MEGKGAGRGYERRKYYENKESEESTNFFAEEFT